MPKPKKIFYGWWIVLATSVIHFWGSGTFFYSFTAFFNPIVDEFGWSYAAVSIAASLRSIEAGIASPLVGFATDRYGPRRIIFLGSILGGIGFILFSQIHSLWSFYLNYLFLSIGLSLMYPLPGWTAVANWFFRKRGTALGILSGAVGIGGILVYLINWLIGLYGWRGALIIIGIGVWVVGIPLSLVVKGNPEAYGYAPDGEEDTPAPVSNSGEFSQGGNDRTQEFGVMQAIKTKAFWAIALAMTASGGTLAAVVVHIMPYLISIDFARESASLVASLLVLVSFAGRVGFGWLADRANSRYLFAGGLLLQAMGLIVLTCTKALGQAIIFTALFGTGFGGLITLRLTIQAEYFGRKSFGGIQGTIKAIMIAGTMTSPFLAGLLFDHCGSYRMAWIVMAAVILASIPLALSAYSPREKTA